VHVERKPDEYCALDSVPESFADGEYMKDEFKGVYKHKDHQYVSKRSFKRHCSIVDDITAHPILAFIMQVLAAVFAILMLCLVFTCCKYRSVSTSYESLKQRDTADSTIVNRNSAS